MVPSGTDLDSGWEAADGGPFQAATGSGSVLWTGAQTHFGSVLLR